MATEREKRDELVQFLDRKVFKPVLRASANRPVRDAKARLSNVKQSTESEMMRFHDEARTAADVRDRYLDDLGSEAGQRISRELDELDLPSLPKVRAEFTQLCDRLGVEPRK